MYPDAVTWPEKKASLAVIPVLELIAPAVWIIPLALIVPEDVMLPSTFIFASENVTSPPEGSIIKSPVVSIIGSVSKLNRKYSVPDFSILKSSPPMFVIISANE